MAPDVFIEDLQHLARSLMEREQGPDLDFADVEFAGR